jgi:hypothetical protein
MSARRRHTRGGKVVVDSTAIHQTQDFTHPPPIQQTQDFIEGDTREGGFYPPSSRKRSRAANDGIIASTQPPVDQWTLLTRVLLRSVFFQNNEKSRYVSIVFYPAHDYQIFVEFGGSRIQPITLTEQHVKTSAGHLPKLCEAMYLGERYTCKDGVFRLQCSGTYSVA